MHGQYAGCNSNLNASLECLWKFKAEIFPPSAPFGVMLGGLVHTIDEIGKENEGKLKQQDHLHRFTSIPEVQKEVLDQIVSRHPKFLACVFMITKEKHIADTFV